MGAWVGVGDDHRQTYPVLAADNRSTQVPYSPFTDRFEHFGSHFDSMMICRFLCIEGIWQKREISELKQRIEKPFEISKVYLLSRCQNFWCDGLGFLLRDITVLTPLIEFDSCDFMTFQHEGIWEKREISKLKQGIEKPFEISNVCILSRRQNFWRDAILDGVTCRSFEATPGQKFN